MFLARPVTAFIENPNTISKWFPNAPILQVFSVTVFCGVLSLQRI
jgi:hypothetical protein